MCQLLERLAQRRGGARALPHGPGQRSGMLTDRKRHGALDLQRTGAGIAELRDDRAGAAYGGGVETQRVATQVVVAADVRRVQAGQTDFAGDRLQCVLVRRQTADR